MIGVFNCLIANQQPHFVSSDLHILTLLFLCYLSVASEYGKPSH